MKVSKLARMMLASVLVLGLVGSLTAEPVPVMIEALAPTVRGMRTALADGSVIYVDADATGVLDGTSWENAFTTLQAALEDAAGGEEIWVAEGTYTPTYLFSPGDPRSATFQLKNGVALYGGFDPTVGDTGWEDRDWVNNESILSGDIGSEGDPADNSYHVFYHPSELALDGSAILDGFTVTGGRAAGGGGGMRNDGSSPTVANCTFSDNSATSVGGGMYNHSSSPAVTDCTFSGNSTESVGGGMYNGSSSPVVTNCIFVGNSAVHQGGGMFNEGSSPTVTNCTFSGNLAGSYGGGMANRDSSPLVTNCIFLGNLISYGGGGGMFNELSSAPTVTNCTFSGNSGSHYGGGIYNVDSSPRLTNCTFSGNSVSYHGGGMFNHADSAPAVTNCIFWGDTAGGLPNEIYDSDSEPVVTYSDIQGGYDGIGNIDADPLFVDPGSGDYHLSPGSLCIDAGDDAAPYLHLYDFEGGPRIVDGDGDGTAIVDIGVDEKRIHFVDGEATTGVGDGTSWEDAFTDPQSALAEAVVGDQIWVAEGTYTPSLEFFPGDPRSATFQLRNGVALYGGFNPSESATGWGDRDWAVHETVLSGDIGAQGEPVDNSYHVFYHPPELALDSSAVLDGFTITGGNASGLSATHDHGGGMYNGNSSPTVTNCIFSGNSAELYGGGMCNDSSSPVITNCTFASNSANSSGGGMANWSKSSPALTNCTFSGNSASVDGGGISNYDSSPTVTNCILWGDTLPEVSDHSGSRPVITYSDIQGGYGGDGNTDADPLLVDPANGDFHLSPDSPCIDVADNDAPDLSLQDFEGDRRVLDGDHDGTATVDMGVDEVYEAAPPVIFVDLEASGANDGRSWADAFTSLQAALFWAEGGVEIWVAEGVYRPTEEFSPGDPRSATFQLKNGVALYGGFDPSVGATGWENRDWALHETILSGDLNGDDAPPFGNNEENSYHVFYHPSELALDATAILDGFTVSGGNSDTDSAPNTAGGGMHNVDSSPTVANCTFSDNMAYFVDEVLTGAGGGMYNRNASPAVTNCAFLGNSAFFGGGMYNVYSSPAVTDCTFSGNSVATEGGGMLNYGSSPAVTNCTFSGNWTKWGGSHGGGMYNWAGSSPLVTNCTFLDNRAKDDGGGMANDSSSPTLINCTFSGNQSEYASGGGIYNTYSSSPTLTNCILWNDTPQEIYNHDVDSIPVVTYSDVQGGYSGTGNIDDDPLFLAAASGDLHLGAQSPCIDVGNNDAPTLPDVDFESDTRIVDGDRDGTATVDMGVDEVLLHVYLPVVLRGD